MENCIIGFSNENEKGTSCFITMVAATSSEGSALILVFLALKKLSNSRHFRSHNL
jgi:hypothetical protein